MDGNTPGGEWDKSKLPSRHVSVGNTSAPHRAFYYAMGMTDEEIRQPFVGVVTTWNEAAPCNIALSRQAQAAKAGVREAGGTPREFTTITVTDGIAMGHDGMRSSLVSREVIADSTELTVRGHSYDALVGLAGCDKSLPGLMMAMLRLNIPSVFMYGGSILPGKFKGKDVTIIDVFEGVGANAAGTMSDEDLLELECAACPSAGACGDGVDQEPAPPPRHRDPQGVRKRGRHRGRDRRFDQRGPASAGHGRGSRYRVRPHGCLRDLPQDTLYRRPEAGRQICRQGSV